MKKYGSVFILYNRMILFRVLLIFVGMAILEVILLALSCQTEGIEKIFSICLLLITVILCSPDGRQGTQKYTLWRLRISERGLFGCRIMVSLLYYFLFWALQVGIAYGMGRYFMYIRGTDSPQSTVIAFYTDNFFHHLFPLEAYHIWAWDAVLLVGLSIVSAAFSFYWQRRKFYYPIILFFFLVFLLWDCNGILEILVSAVIMLTLYVLTLYSVWKRSDVRED